jgi:hypothetical protein
MMRYVGADAVMADWLSAKAGAWYADFAGDGEHPGEVVKGSKTFALEPVGDPRFHAKLREIGALHDQKQRDYGTDTDPFANVRGSADWGVAPWLGAMVRANDKIKRLQTYAHTGVLANEGVADAFMDLAVYALIGLILWEEEQ